VLIVVFGDQEWEDTANDIQQTVSLGEYVRQTITALGSGLSLRKPDILLARSFWGGFGWHHSPLPEWLMRGLAGGAGLGLALGFWGVWRRREPDRALWLPCWGVGLLATGALTGAAAYVMGFPNVHGRYLLGYYSLLLGVCYAGYGLWFERPGGLARFAGYAGLVACGAVHALSMVSLLARTYG